MRGIPTRLHGILDYTVAALLIALPWLLGFYQGGAESWTPILVGVGIIGYSLVTDYELGLVRRLQMPVHLWLDGILGLLLALSPWLFGFDREVWAPHLVVGIFSMAVALFTNTIPGYERRRSVPL